MWYLPKNFSSLYYSKDQPTDWRISCLWTHLLSCAFLQKVLITPFPETPWNSGWWILSMSPDHRKGRCKYKKYLGPGVSFKVEITFIIHFLQVPVQATVMKRKKKLWALVQRRNSTKERHSNIFLWFCIFVDLSPLWTWPHHLQSRGSVEQSFESRSLIIRPFIFISLIKFCV